MAKKEKEVVEAVTEEAITEDTTNNVDLSGLEGMSKTNAMSVIMKQMGDMKGDHWVEFFKKVQAQVGHEGDKAPDAAAKNAASTAAKGSIKEDLAAVFGDNETLSEDFKTKASTLFEAAVSLRSSVIEAELEEAYEAKLVDEVAEIKESLVEALDQLTSAIAKDWGKANEVAIVKNVRSELAESFVAGLTDLYKTHNFNVPEDQVEVVDMLAAKVDDLETKLNAKMVENIELNSTVEKLVKESILDELSEGMTDTDKERFSTLVESFDIEDDVDVYIAKLETIKEQHFGKKTAPKNSTGIITEEIAHATETDPADKKVSPDMKAFVEALNRTRVS